MRDEALIGLAYRAAIEPEAWDQLFGELRSRLDAESSLLRVYDPHCRHLELNLTAGFDPTYQQVYRERFVDDDPVRDAVVQLEPCEMTRTDDILPFSRLRRTPFYNEYMRPQGKRYAIGGPVTPDRNMVAILGFQRGETAGNFTRDQCQWLRRFAPHVQQTLRLRHRLQGLESRCATLSALLDAAPVAAFGISFSGEVLLTNAPADKLIAVGGVLEVRRSRLRDSRDRLDARLQKLIWSALRPARDGVSREPGAMTVPVESEGERFLSILVIPWKTPVQNDVGSARGIGALVLAGPVDADAVGPIGLVADGLRITRAEARLVLALIEAGHIEGAASANGIRLETARSYLKSAMRKTGCRRQGELIQRALQSPVGQFPALVRGQDHVS